MAVLSPLVLHRFPGASIISSTIYSSLLTAEDDSEYLESESTSYSDSLSANMPAKTSSVDNVFCIVCLMKTPF